MHYKNVEFFFKGKGAYIKYLDRKVSKEKIKVPESNL